MIQVNSIYVFTTVIECGGFSGAARKLGVSTAAVSKNIKQLESELGITLFHRSTRKVSPTDNAVIIFQKAKNVLAGVEEIKNFAAVLHNVPMGTLRISCPISIGTYLLLPYLNEFLIQFPELNADVEFNDHKIISLDRDQIDILLGRTMQAILGYEEDIVGLKLFKTRNVLCASSTYFTQKNKPTTLQDVNNHFYIFHKNRNLDSFVQACALHGVHLINKLMVNSTDGLVQGIKEGMGLGLVPIFTIKDEIQKGEIILLENIYIEEPIDLYMFYRKSRFNERKIVQFKEFILNKVKFLQNKI